MVGHKKKTKNNTCLLNKTLYNYEYFRKFINSWMSFTLWEIDSNVKKSL